jgi:hypothetical protein
VTQDAVWKCRDGRRVPVREMETDHVGKALSMLRRKGFIDPSEFHYWPPPSGEHARDAWEEWVLSVRISRFVGIFESELERRQCDREYSAAIGRGDA